MMRPINFRNLLLVFVVLGVVAPGTFGQQSMRNYNPATEVTVRGTVEEVRQVARGPHWGGTHLTLKTEGGTLDVHLGPSHFLEAKHFTIAKGDDVEVIGSKIQYQGHDALIARQITRGGQKLMLRNAQGIPEWSRRGRRN